MQLHQDNSQRQIQSQKIAPQLIQANTLLQCSTLELQQMIAQEQWDNPALEVALDDVLTDGLAADAGQSAEDDAPHHGDDAPDSDRRALLKETGLLRIESAGGMAVTPSGDADFDPLMLARAETTLADHLLTQLRAASHSRADVFVAEYLVDSLDERGYLHIDMEAACATLHASCTEVMEGIKRLQACDPPGVGARDLRECLLLQMRHLREQGDEAVYDPITERLLADHWDSLAQRRYAPLARSLGVTAARIETAVHFIQEQLTPHPAAQFRQPWDYRPDSQSVAVRPDVVIKRTPAGFEVEVLGFENTALQINPHYRDLYESIRTARSSGAVLKPSSARLSPDHEKHVIAYVERANLFLKNLQQRRRTIQKITQALIECQQGFLETGQRAFLRPLTRTRLARIVDMHESTVSRALMHKYVQLPTQEVMPFDMFFENAVTAKDAIAALIALESLDTPFSDQAIVEALNERGMQVARRTVVKYREELRIPASYLRRRR